MQPCLPGAADKLQDLWRDTSPFGQLLALLVGPGCARVAEAVLPDQHGTVGLAVLGLAGPEGEAAASRYRQAGASCLWCYQQRMVWLQQQVPQAGAVAEGPEPMQLLPNWRAVLPPALGSSPVLS